MNDPMLPLPGLSPVSGKRAEIKFDGGVLSSDGLNCPSSISNGKPIPTASSSLSD